MKTIDINLLDKAEVKAMTKENTKLDITMKEHMDKLERTIKALSAEYDRVKAIAKETFGKEGGNGIFSTETRVSYILNMDELTELIGADKVEELKNKEKESTYVHW